MKNLYQKLTKNPNKNQAKNSRKKAITSQKDELRNTKWITWKFTTLSSQKIIA